MNKYSLFFQQVEIAQTFPETELPVFPIKGSDLVKSDVPRGPKFAMTLSELRTLWIESKYTLTTEQLLEKIPHVLENLPEKRKDQKTHNAAAKKMKKIRKS